MYPEIIQNDGSYALTLEFASGMVSPLILDAVRRVVKDEGAPNASDHIPEDHDS